jgi:hypothetical protein
MRNDTAGASRTQVARTGGHAVVSRHGGLQVSIVAPRSGWNDIPVITAT